ncbi:MAG: GTPase Era [Myxococcota bacterium]
MEVDSPATDALEGDIPEDGRAGRCAIVGRPNVGKSTLLNALLGQKLVIATARPGTTRSCVLGVMVEEDPPTQIAFVDTPGIGRSQTNLHRMLVEEARAGLSDVEVVLLLTDLGKRGRAPEDRADDPVYEAARAARKPIVVAINKVDRVENKPKILPLLQRWLDREGVVAVVPISATRKTNLKELVGELRNQLPEGWLYPDDTLTDRPERFFAAEFIREAALERTRAEVPHGVAVAIDEFHDDDGLTRIHATLVVEKPSHKGIVIGAGGQRLKEIGSAARREIEAMIGRKVFLKLWVKVVEGWTRNPQKARELLKEDAR